MSIAIVLAKTTGTSFQMYQPFWSKKMSGVTSLYDSLIIELLNYFQGLGTGQSSDNVYISRIQDRLELKQCLHFGKETPVSDTWRK